MKIVFNENVRIGTTLHRKGEVADIPDVRAKAFVGAKMATVADASKTTDAAAVQTDPVQIKADK